MFAIFGQHSSGMWILVRVDACATCIDGTAVDSKSIVAQFA